MRNAKVLIMLLVVALATGCTTTELRSDVLLEEGWRFTKGDIAFAENVDFDDSDWEEVVVPHDWAIYGPFSSDNDCQKVAITQNFET
ncbi:MAG: beta-galactosidase, partial [Alistipes sp.]|nr:beta-galactosidase [Alistipes sp.]